MEPGRHSHPREVDDAYETLAVIRDETKPPDNEDYSGDDSDESPLNQCGLTTHESREGKSRLPCCPLFGLHVEYDSSDDEAYYTTPVTTEHPLDTPIEVTEVPSNVDIDRKEDSCSGPFTRIAFCCARMGKAITNCFLKCCPRVRTAEDAVNAAISSSWKPPVGIPDVREATRRLPSHLAVEAELQATKTAIGLPQIDVLWLGVTPAQSRLGFSNGTNVTYIHDDTAYDRFVDSDVAINIAALPAHDSAGHRIDKFWELEIIQSRPWFAMFTIDSTQSIFLNEKVRNSIVDNKSFVFTVSDNHFDVDQLIHYDDRRDVFYMVRETHGTVPEEDASLQCDGIFDLTGRHTNIVSTKQTFQNDEFHVSPLRRCSCIPESILEAKTEELLEVEIAMLALTSGPLMTRLTPKVLRKLPYKGVRWFCTPSSCRPWCYSEMNRGGGFDFDPRRDIQELKCELPAGPLNQPGLRTISTPTYLWATPRFVFQFLRSADNEHLVHIHTDTGASDGTVKSMRIHAFKALLFVAIQSLDGPSMHVLNRGIISSSTGTRSAAGTAYTTATNHVEAIEEFARYYKDFLSPTTWFVPPRTRNVEEIVEDTSIEESACPGQYVNIRDRLDDYATAAKTMAFQIAPELTRGIAHCKVVTNESLIETARIRLQDPTNRVQFNEFTVLCREEFVSMIKTQMLQGSAGHTQPEPLTDEEWLLTLNAKQRKRALDEMRGDIPDDLHDKFCSEIEGFVKTGETQQGPKPVRLVFAAFIAMLRLIGQFTIPLRDMLSQLHFWGPGKKPKEMTEWVRYYMGHGITENALDDANVIQRMEQNGEEFNQEIDNLPEFNGNIINNDASKCDAHHTVDTRGVFTHLSLSCFANERPKELPKHVRETANMTMDEIMKEARAIVLKNAAPWKFEDKEVKTLEEVLTTLEHNVNVFYGDRKKKEHPDAIPLGRADVESYLNGLRSDVSSFFPSPSGRKYSTKEEEEFARALRRDMTSCIKIKNCVRRDARDHGVPEEYPLNLFKLFSFGLTSGNMITTETNTMFMGFLQYLSLRLLTDSNGHPIPKWACLAHIGVCFGDDSLSTVSLQAAAKLTGFDMKVEHVTCDGESTWQCRLPAAEKGYTFLSRTYYTVGEEKLAALSHRNIKRFLTGFVIGYGTLRKWQNRAIGTLAMEGWFHANENLRNTIWNNDLVVQYTLAILRIHDWSYIAECDADSHFEHYDLSLMDSWHRDLAIGFKEFGGYPVAKSPLEQRRKSESMALECGLEVSSSNKVKEMMKKTTGRESNFTVDEYLKLPTRSYSALCQALRRCKKMSDLEKLQGYTNIEIPPPNSDDYEGVPTLNDLDWSSRDFQTALEAKNKWALSVYNRMTPAQKAQAVSEK